MREGDWNVIKYDIYRSFGIKGFEKSYKVLISGLLQSLYLLFAIRPNKIFDGNELIRRRLSNSYGNKTIKLKLVDFPKALLRRFRFNPYIFIRSDPGISGFKKDKFFRTSSYRNYSAL